ncbi:MAG: TIGR02597 family protein [Verrucomicrobiota bacterium]
MNLKHSLLLPAVLAATCFASTWTQAQTTVSTDPVGFVSTDLPASGFTYLAVNLTTPPVLVSSNTTLTGANVTIGGNLTTLDSNKAYFMEIKSGTYEGYSADISSWSGQTLTLSEDLEAGGVVKANFDNSQVCIQELPTLSSIFGASNSAGLKAGLLTDADRIYLYESGEFKKYYYFGGGFGRVAGWYDEDGNESGSKVIHFGDGMVIETQDTSAKTISISGNVKLGPTNIPLYPGFNLISNPSPINGSLTLANSGIQNGIKAGLKTDADIVYIPTPSGAFNRYHYFNGGFGRAAGWYNADTDALADSTPLPNSGSFFIQRDDTSTSVTIAEELPNN